MKLINTVGMILCYLLINNVAHGRTILITASTGALGEAISTGLGEKGYNLIITGRNIDKLVVLQKKLQEKYKTIKIQTAIIDFTNTETIRKAVKEIENNLDGIVLVGPRPMMSRNIPKREEWQKMFDETFMGPLEVIRLFDKKIQGDGSIVVISRNTSEQYSPTHPNTNVVRLAWSGEVKNLAYYYGKRKIRVNAISSGSIMTKSYIDIMKEKAQIRNITYQEQLAQEVSSIPLERYGESKDVSNLAAFLLSKEAKHINGTNIILDGGESKAY